MQKITIAIDDSLYQALQRGFDEGNFDTLKAYYNLLLTKGYYSYIASEKGEDEAGAEKPRMTKQSLLDLLRETYRGRDRNFLDYVASFIIYRYREGEIDYLKGIGTVQGDVAEMLIDGWKLNFRLKVLFLYYIFPEKILHEVDLSILSKDDNRHPLFTVLQAIDKMQLLPEEEARVKYLLQHFEEWNAGAFSTTTEDDDDSGTD